jgi:hypothetical protein
MAHSSTYLTCGGYITRNTDIDGESTLKWAATRTNNTNISILKWELKDRNIYSGPLTYELNSFQSAGRKSRLFFP